jgi:hypothetical protein
MTNERGRVMVEDGGGQKKFDLAERTAKFGEAAIEFVITLPRNAVTSPLISQLVRSATSVGLNYCEADELMNSTAFLQPSTAKPKMNSRSTHWSLVIGHWSFKTLVIGHWSLVI